MPTRATRRRTPLTHVVVGAVVLTLTACLDDTTAPRPVASRGLSSDVTASSIVTVTNTSDDGSAGSLRVVIANAAAGSTVHFDPSIAGQTITLVTGEIDLDKSLTIEGPVPGGIVISGGGKSRVFEAGGPLSNTVTLRNLTITGGKTDGNGGGVLNSVTTTIDHSLITGNAAALVGGGIVNFASLTVTNSTISGNSSGGDGGGIYNNSALTLANVTIVDNTGIDGGGVRSVKSVIGDATIDMRNSIVANNTSSLGANCLVDPGATLHGTNLSNDNTCGAASTFMIIADPRLGGLADNGGPTQTTAILRDSPALDAVPASECTLPNDQRYVTRPQGPACDIGALEFSDYEKTPTTIGGSVIVNPASGSAIVTGTTICPEVLALTLHVSLSEPMKVGRVNTTVTASRDLPVCTAAGTQNWAVSLTPATLSFGAGSGTVGATTTGTPKFVLPVSLNTPVKMVWGHK